MTYSKELQDRLEQFTRYARFLSKRFGVRVELDGTNASTEGKTILLPNIAVLTPREIEFMYGVLLHEVGHIKYSSFSEADFAKLSNSMVAHMANSIEDARIENLLIAEYDGAYDIFHSLYCDYLDDKKLMKKIFNTEIKKAGGFDALGHWMHGRILNIKNLPLLSEMVSPYIAKQVNQFVKMHSLDLLMEHVVLENWDDVVALANHVTELWFNGNLKKQGPKNNILEQRNTVDQLQQKLGADLQKKVQQVRDELVRMENEINDKKTQKSDFLATPDYIEAQEELQKANTDEKKCQNEKMLADKADDASQRAKRAEAGVAGLNEKITNAQERLAKIEGKPPKATQDTQDLIDKLAAKENKLTGRADEKSMQQLEKVQTKLADARKLVQEKGAQPIATELEKAQARISDLQDNKNTQTQKTNDLKKLAATAIEEAVKRVPDMMNMSGEEREQKMNNAREKLAEANNKMHDMNAELEKLEKDIDDLMDRMQQKEEKLAKDAKKILANAQDALNQASVPVNLLPDFMPNPGWEQGDEVQKEFDHDARQQKGEWVVNGAGLGTGGRNILMYIEKRAKALDTVDLAKVFKQRHHISKLDSMNEVTTDATYIIDHQPVMSDNAENSRDHVPLTTEFDKVNLKMQGDGTQLAKLKETNDYFIRPFVRIMQQKLKFTRKNHFRGNQEEGDLDARSLWKLASGEGDDFFEVNQRRFVNKISACIAVDISGSQDKDFTQHGEKLQVLTAALAEALKQCHIRHEIIGYHAPVEQAMREVEASGSYNRNSNRLETEVYKTFNHPHHDGIMNMELQASDNSDGESLRIVMARLKKSATPRKVLFVITDGKPFLSNTDVGVLDNDLRAALLEAKRNRIEVIAFGFTEQRAVFYDQYCHIKTWQDALDWAKDKMK